MSIAMLYSFLSISVMCYWKQRAEAIVSKNIWKCINCGTNGIKIQEQIITKTQPLHTGT